MGDHSLKGTSYLETLKTKFTFQSESLKNENDDHPKKFIKKQENQECN